MSKKRMIKLFNWALLISFLTIAIPLGLALLTAIEVSYAIFWFIAYSNLLVLFPLILISLISLIVRNLTQHGLYAGAEKSSLRILVVILAGSLIYVGVNELKYRNNRLEVTFQNKTAYPVKYIKLFGRGALTELDSLGPYSDTTLIFKGKSILRNVENHYENEVTLLYYTDSTHFRQPLLKDFGLWTVFNGPFGLEFHGLDSVVFEYVNKID